jgi:hypothetical protein
MAKVKRSGGQGLGKPPKPPGIDGKLIPPTS